MTEDKLTLPAFAKINLGLRVKGRRVDGYHEISTVFQTITLHDSLTFELMPAESVELNCSDPDIPTDESNLVVRAAVALCARFGVRCGVRVELEKRIPAGGGLGGGSSDAAVTLIALAHLWNIETDKRELEEIGAPLGADVPFFLTGGTALGMGTGTDILSLEDAPKMHLAVAMPGVHVSTAEAYKRLNAPALTKAEGVANLSVSRTEADFSGFICGVTRNDFEAVVFGLYPEIERARDVLKGLGAHRALLSGSGSSVFGVFDSKEEVERACEALRDEVGWQVFACATLTRAEYLRELGRGAAVLQSSREG
ncbi:MAG: 4-(cytidine 5'-diphospho)-2-C-methyl-D-erythritol kinase [Rubrivivax sp.]|nr:4-(cytidine 5'-diphospho)-2-C-methyl-D-erythritol kinase [Pyrinomonadaceae bacterium]